jgi:hypothetical protein
MKFLLMNNGQFVVGAVVGHNNREVGVLSPLQSEVLGNVIKN